MKLVLPPSLDGSYIYSYTHDQVSTQEFLLFSLSDDRIVPRRIFHRQPKWLNLQRGQLNGLTAPPNSIPSRTPPNDNKEVTPKPHLIG